MQYCNIHLYVNDCMAIVRGASFMVSPHDISNTFPETADIETASDDYAGRFADAVGAWMLKIHKVNIGLILMGFVVIHPRYE